MMATADGFRGIWFTLGQMCDYGDKYSGGLGTYTAKHVPLAVYAPAVNRTFFVYGGARADGERHLLAMVSSYDHATHRLRRPVIVHDKGGVDDPHDNPSTALDEHGHLWVFVSGRGRKRPGFIYRSRAPYDIGDFEQVLEGELTYPQPWWIDGQGFVHLFTRYTGVRELYWSRSDDGRTWTPERKLAGMEGHYQTSRRVPEGGVSGCGAGLFGATRPAVITAFNRHPEGHPDNRTDLFFCWTEDRGDTWRAADGTVLDLPLTQPDNPARVRDFAAEQRLVYMKDIAVDAAGNPVILVVTSAAFAPGPAGEPREWTLCRWTGSAWRFSMITRSTHNYDMGSLLIEGDGPWRVIAPTEPGPQHWGTGGEMALWTSDDDGETWTMLRQLTSDSARNHAYARRPVNAAPEFVAFWADGNPDELSVSRLYFCDWEGRVFRMPPETLGDEVEPEKVTGPTT
jgi:hypothetical protein